MSFVAVALFVPQLLWNTANIQTYDSLICGPLCVIRAWTLEKKTFIHEPTLVGRYNKYAPVENIFSSTNPANRWAVRTYTVKIWH